MPIAVDWAVESGSRRRPKSVCRPVSPGQLEQRGAGHGGGVGEEDDGGDDADPAGQEAQPGAERAAHPHIAAAHVGLDLVEPGVRARDAQDRDEREQHDDRQVQAHGAGRDAEADADAGGGRRGGRGDGDAVAGRRGSCAERVGRCRRECARGLLRRGALIGPDGGTSNSSRPDCVNAVVIRAPGS